MKRTLRNIFCTTYHLTPWENKGRIERVGLLPEMDRREQGRIWLCAIDEIESVARHLAKQKGYLTPVAFAVFQVDYPDDVVLNQSSVEGRYYIKVRIRPEHIDFKAKVKVGAPPDRRVSVVAC